MVLVRFLLTNVIVSVPDKTVEELATHAAKIVSRRRRRRQRSLRTAPAGPQTVAGWQPPSQISLRHP